MRLHKIDLKGLVLPNNLLVAPLAGYTNAVFREMCVRLGAGLTFTEMVSAKGLCYNSENTRELLSTLQLPPEYGAINAVQLFGCEPEYMERAACCEYIAPFDLIDINMGCPVPKIFKNGEGSALLNDISLAQKLVKAAVKSGKKVTVKFRTGVDGGHLVTRDFAVAMRDAGAAMLTVHGRTRVQMYSGEVNLKEIAAAKAAVDIPVIANGGVFSADDADRLLNETGADGVMLARGAMYNPFLISEISGADTVDKKQVIRRQLHDTFANFDSRFATVYMRKMLAFYIKGQPNAAATRVRLMGANSKQDIEEIFNGLQF